MNYKYVAIGVLMAAGLLVYSKISSAASLQIVPIGAALTLTGIMPTIKAQLQFTNPTSNDLTITGITGAASYNGAEIGALSYATQTKIPAGISTIWVPIILKPSVNVRTWTGKVVIEISGNVFQNNASYAFKTTVPVL